MAEYHESWIDRQIREAQERGAFDNLKGAGKPLESINGRDDPDWWVRGLMEREKISHAELLPAGIRLRRELEDLHETLAAARSERDVRAIVTDLNDRIRDARKPRATEPPVFIRAVDVDEAVAIWRAGRTKKTGPRPSS